MFEGSFPLTHLAAEVEEVVAHIRKDLRVRGRELRRERKGEGEREWRGEGG